MSAWGLGSARLDTVLLLRNPSAFLITFGHCTKGQCTSGVRGHRAALAARLLLLLMLRLLVLLSFRPARNSWRMPRRSRLAKPPRERRERKRTALTGVASWPRLRGWPYSPPQRIYTRAGVAE